MNKNLQKFQEFKKKIVIGTAQFGKVYGINNINKNPLKTSVVKLILKNLSKNGINHLDNAEGYGFKINILGKKNFTIDTKILICKRNSLEHNLKKIIENYKKKNLKISSIYIHNPKLIFTKYGKIIYKNLKYLKKKKLFKNIGVSVYDLKLLKKIVSKLKIDVVQLPYNILDRRFENYFKILKKKKILIYARSVFLQGALLSKKSNKINKSKEVKKFHNFTKKNRVSNLYTCIEFVIKNKLINKVVVGIDNNNQLKQILRFKLQNKNLSLNDLQTNNLKIIDPRYW